MKAKFEFKISGFIIGMILIAMFGTIFATIIANMSDNYGVTNPESFDKYSEYTGKLQNDTENIKDATKIGSNQNWVDIIGAYFSAGYSALKTAVTSFNLFGTMMDDATNDLGELSLFKTYIVMIVLVAIFVGVVVAVLVKFRI